MIPTPPSIQTAADLTLYAAMGVCASFGIGLLALGARYLREAWRQSERSPTMEAEQ